MKILVTGSEGRIGSALAKLLLDEGYEICTFDVKARPPCDWQHIPGDLRDISTVRRAMQGVDAVVHLGAIPNDRDDDTVLMDINVMGTWNVLQSALECDVRRVVFFSSINAQGSVKGHWPTEYLPVDDHYPHHPTTPYQLSKHLGEEICRSFSERHGMVTLCLRPVWVVTNEMYERFKSIDVGGFWKHEYWAYVHVEDVCDAALRSLLVENISHSAFLLAADDTTVSVPTAELVTQYYANTPWHTIERSTYLRENPYRGLIDCSRAKTVLGWHPKHSWRYA